MANGAPHQVRKDPSLFPDPTENVPREIPLAEKEGCGASKAECHSDRSLSFGHTYPGYGMDVRKGIEPCPDAGWR